jgi:hypothetical protein
MTYMFQVNTIVYTILTMVKKTKLLYIMKNKRAQLIL